MSTDAWLRRAAIHTARELRKNMTPTEAILWERLRDRQFAEMKFYRQHPLHVEFEGRETFVIADFYCHSHGLIVEIDGPIHQGETDHDRARTKALEELGLRVIRFTNSQVLHDLDRVLQVICQARMDR
jgi:very-short-patch-repair endonuclease